MIDPFLLRLRNRVPALHGDPFLGSICLHTEPRPAGLATGGIHQHHVGNVDGGFKITKIDLTTKAEVPGIDQDDFNKFANGAKENCPVSQALAGVTISLNATLL